jgi:hypothetical protein
MLGSISVLGFFFGGALAVIAHARMAIAIGAKSGRRPFEAYSRADPWSRLRLIGDYRRMFPDGRLFRSLVIGGALMGLGAGGAVLSVLLRGR